MKPATALERHYMDRVAQLPCLVPGKRPVTLHHVTAHADRKGRFARSHRLVVPLAAEYHLAGYDPSASRPISVERLGHQGFYKRHGIDLLAEAERLWTETLTLKLAREIEQAKREREDG